MAPPVSRSKPTDADGKRLYEMMERYASDNQITSDEAEQAIKASKKTWVNPKAKKGIDSFLRDYCPAGLKLDSGAREQFLKIGVDSKVLSTCAKSQSGGWKRKNPDTKTPQTPEPTPTPEPQPETEKAYRARVESAVAAVSRTFYDGLLKQDQKYPFSMTFVVAVKIDPEGKIAALEIKEVVITKLPKNKRAEEEVEKAFQKQLKKHLQEWAARQDFGPSPAGKEMTIEIPLSLKPKESPSTTAVKEEELPITPTKSQEPEEKTTSSLPESYTNAIRDQLMSRLIEIYKRHKKTDSGLEGKVVILITFDASGKVTDAVVVENETGNRKFASDLVTKVKTFKLPEEVATGEVEKGEVILLFHD
jgi:outer membrane biosynthesis protein TonB